MRWSRRGAYAADQLFATLDTTTRQLYLRRRRSASASSLSDTVGFIRDLPHRLVEAFEATCRRPPMPTCCCTWSTAPTRSSPSRSPRSSACCARSAPTRVPQVLVFNKLDAARRDAAPARHARPCRAATARRVPRVFVSARDRRGPRRAARAARRKPSIGAADDALNRAEASTSSAMPASDSAEPANDRSSRPTGTYHPRA